MNDNLREKLIISSVGIFFACLCLFVFTGIVIGDITRAQSIEFYKKEFNSQDAIIKSPAVIIVCDTYTEFTSFKGSVFYYSNSFYRIPDAYIGYVWTPKANGYWNGTNIAWELINK